MSLPELTADLAFALALADEADAVTLGRFRGADLRSWDKKDHTPVTEADCATEELLRTRLALGRPGDGVLGEEYGSAVGSGGLARQWIVDPIDGTKNYLRGVPVWATLIALACEERVELGVVSAPALGQRWWAATGLGAFTAPCGIATASDRAPRRLRVSNVAKLSEASLSYASLGGWAQRGQLPAFLDLMSRCGRTRAYGDFWGYMLLAEGAVDLVAEPELAVYDMAALVPIVTEAGGEFTDLGGAMGPWGGNALASNGRLHAAALATLGRASTHAERNR